MICCCPYSVSNTCKTRSVDDVSFSGFILGKDEKNKKNKTTDDGGSPKFPAVQDSLLHTVTY